jgi:hypothetical protein
MSKPDGEATPRYDVLIASDFSFPGGTGASIAEEIKAQAAAGYVTGLLHVECRPRPFNPRIRRCVEEGLAELVVTSGPIATRLLLMRQPWVFREPQQTLARVEADRALLVVNQAPADAASDTPYYDPIAVAASLTGVLRQEVEWWPVSPQARRTIAPFRSHIDLAARDWFNVIDVDEWQFPRDRFVADRPVIGRHGRADPAKWPTNRDDLLAIYPDRDAYTVKLLGGDEIPRRILGELPANWSVLPFGSVSPREFLGQIDFYVHFDQPGHADAFPRSMLEAVASGAVTIAGAPFRELFEDACLYAEPADVTNVVDGLYRDPARYAAISTRARARVRERFGYEIHARRLEDLIGPPSGARRRYRVCRSTAAARVLFVTGNGAGGDDPRQALALARLLSPRFQSLFFTPAPAVARAVAQAGWPVESLDSRRDADGNIARGNAMLRQRLESIVAMHRPAVVVFAGREPFPGLPAIRRNHAGVRFVWCRSAVGQDRSGDEASATRSAFDLVIAPGLDEHGAREAAKAIEAVVPASPGRA